jgi:nucleoside-diphosphate-sugar epimerase
MAPETVVVTGGNGTIGSAIIRELNEHGYGTVDLARGERREEDSDRYLTTDLTDASDVFGSLARADADAVIHMGTIPSPHGHPLHTVYESNVLSGLYILEAAGGMGIDRVVLPSSVNAIGADFQPEPTDVRYLPVDEAHPATPRDPYAYAKRAMEITADGIGRSEDGPRTISSLRYPWIGDDEAVREQLAEPDRTLSSETVEGARGRDALFSYIHLKDAASIARRAVEADFDGHEVFWAVAEDTSMDAPSARLAEKVYPDVEHRRTFEDYESLISIEKARRLLDWEPEHSWRDASS